MHQNKVSTMKRKEKGQREKEGREKGEGRDKARKEILMLASVYILLASIDSRVLDF